MLVICRIASKTPKYELLSAVHETLVETFDSIKVLTESTCLEKSVNLEAGCSLLCKEIRKSETKSSES